MLQCYVQTPIILYGASALVIVGFLIYLARFGTRSSTIGWFRIFLISSLLFNLAAAWLKCSQTAAEYSLATDIYGFLVAIIVPIMFVFVVYFLNKERWLTKTWVRLAILAYTGFFIFMFWRDELAVSHDITTAAITYGFRSFATGPHTGVIGLFDLVGYGIPFILAAIYYRHLDNPLRKRQTKLIMWSLFMLIMPPVFVEALVPIIFHIPPLPISPVSSVIAYGMMTFAITKYGLRVFNVSNIGNDLMQVMPGGLVVLDHTNTIQYANAGATAMLGAQSLEGASMQKIFASAASYSRFETKILKPSDKTRQVAGQEAELLIHDGRKLAVSLNVVNVFAGQEIINRLVAFTDITPLKQAQAALEAEKAGVERKVVERTHELATAQAKLSASIESLPLGYVMFDRAHNVSVMNPSARRILQYTGSVPSLTAIVKKLNGYDLPGLIETCLSKRQSGEVKELAVEGRYLHLYAAPIIGEGKVVIGAVMLIEDITEEKVLERSKDEFFSIASHELRTPLTSIRGNSSMMMDYYKEALKDPGLQDMVHDVHESSMRLIGIVNDFLDMSRLEQGKVTFKFADTEVAPQIEGVAGELEHEAELKHTILKLDKPKLEALPHVIADADRLKQIVFNLLGNALKFTENGTISVTAKSNADYITISVTDTGRGIPEASQKLLFHKFQQGGASLLTRETAKGTGLGLYISRLMAEGMGGKLWLEKSVEGKGSTFAFTLPIATPQRVADLAKLLLEAQTTDTATGLTTPAKDQK